MIVNGKSITSDEWREILEKHARWARGADGGERADLQGADLQGADLQGADLQGAYLRGADLQGADLQGAYLRGADLRGADLRGADLRGADLQGAYLRGADLRGANLRGADLRGAYLQGADLQGAYLQGAYLQGADLQGADLQGADLQGADLRGADLQGAYLQGAYLQGAKNADLLIARTRILPEGTLIGWKQCRDGVLVKLEIPSDAKRTHAFGRKCRAEFAKVLEIVGPDGARAQAESLHNGAFVYRVGETVRPQEPFAEDYLEECASGIHFYITRIEAEHHA